MVMHRTFSTCVHRILKTLRIKNNCYTIKLWRHIVTLRYCLIVIIILKIIASLANNSKCLDAPSFVSTLYWNVELYEWVIAEIHVNWYVLYSSVRSIVSQWHRQRLQREPYRISQMESVQCLFKHWMQTHFNASKTAIAEHCMGAVIILPTSGKWHWESTQTRSHQLILISFICKSISDNQHIVYRQRHHRYILHHFIHQIPSATMTMTTPIAMAIIDPIYQYLAMQLPRSKSHAYQQWANEM